MIRRRQFITLLGGAAAWPRTAHAQERERARRVGALMTFAADDNVATVRNAAFLQGLERAGWTVGRNLRIEYRWAGGSADAQRKHAEELVALAPDVILATGSAATAPLLRLTRSIPVVFVHTFPIRSAPAMSTAWPGRAAMPPGSRPSSTISAGNG